MLRRNYEPNYAQAHPEKKAHFSYKNFDDGTPNKCTRVTQEPLKSNINQDSINVRLEEIKRKYSEASKPGRLHQNIGSSKERSYQAVENRPEILSYTKSKANKYGPSSPQRTTGKSKFETTCKFPYSNLKQSTFEGQEVFEVQDTHLEVSQAIRYTDQKRVGSIQKINYKIKNILDGISIGKKQYQATSVQVRQINLKSSPRTELRNSGRESRYSPPTSNERVSEALNHDRGTVPGRQRSSSMIATQNLTKSALKTSYVGCPGETKKRLTGKQLDQEIMRIQERIKKSSDQRHRLSELLDRKEGAQKKQPGRAGREDKVVSFQRPYQVDNVPCFGKFQQKIHTIIHSESPKPQERLQSRQKTYSHNHKDHDLYSHKAVTEASCFNLRIMPIPCQQSQNTAEETKKLAMALVEQVKLDEELRNARIWLENLNDPNKWNDVKEHLSHFQGRNIGEHQVKQMFKHTEDQHNPFFVSNANQSTQSVVQKHLKVHHHWSKKVSNSFCVRKLSEEGFQLSSLDLQEKGFIQMQDIVRFLNIETGNFYRNRDVVLIFKRMTRNSKLSFEEFTRTVTFS